MSNKKILYIGTPSVLLYSDSIKKCFEKLDFNILEPEYIKFKDQNRIQKRISRKKFLTEFFHRQNIAYIEAAKKFNPDYVFVLNNSRMNEEFLQYCNTYKLPIFMYRIDSIRWCDKALEHMHYYDEIFSYEPSDTSIEFKPHKFIFPLKDLQYSLKVVHTFSYRIFVITHFYFFKFMFFAYYSI